MRTVTPFHPITIHLEPFTPRVVLYHFILLDLILSLLSANESKITKMCPCE